MSAFVAPPAPMLGPVPLPDVFVEDAAADHNHGYGQNFDYVIGGEPVLLLDDPLADYEVANEAIVAFGLLTPPPSPIIAQQALVDEPALIEPPILGWTTALQEGPIILENPLINIGGDVALSAHDMHDNLLDPEDINAGVIHEGWHIINPGFGVNLEGMDFGEAEEDLGEADPAVEENDQFMLEDDLATVLAVWQ